MSNVSGRKWNACIGWAYLTCVASCVQPVPRIRCDALQQWREAVVLEVPGRTIAGYGGYMKVPKSPGLVWRDMEEFLLEKLVAGMALRDAVEKLRRLYPDYRVAVPRPGVLHVEFVGDWDMPSRMRVVEARFGSEQALARHEEQLQARIHRVRSDMESIGRLALSTRALQDGSGLRDAWNMPFRCEWSGAGVVVKCAGVDSDWNTNDDIVVTVEPKR